MKQRFRRIFSGLAAAVCVTVTASGAVAADAPPSTTSQAYIVMDADTGQVLASKKPDAKMYPASITKVLTCALVLEEHKPAERIILGEEVLDIMPNSTYVALSPGEDVSVQDMLYAAMVRSANDAANALAVFEDGSIAEFAKRMNAKAQEVGAVSSNFVNPSGLPDPNHYITAHDFARITAWALTVPGFTTYFGAPEYTMPGTNLQPESRHWDTYDCLTVESSFTYAGAIGGKTGLTDEAQNTYVSAAERDGLKLVLVDLKTALKYDKFKNAVALYDYCFANYQRVEYTVPDLQHAVQIPYYNGETKLGNVTLSLPSAVPVTIPKGKQAGDIKAELDVPDRYVQGEAISPGLRLTLDGEELYRVPLEYGLQTSMTDAPSEPAAAEPEQQPFRILDIVKTVLLWLLAIPVLFFLVLVILRYVNRYRRRRRRRMRRRQVRQFEDF